MSIYLAIFGKLRYLGLVNIEKQCNGGTWVLLETMRGLEMGTLGGALSPEQEEKYRKVSDYDSHETNLHGTEPMLQEVSFVSVANKEEIEIARQNYSDEDEALIKSRALLAGHKLAIKLVEVEYLFDKKKLFFYFTSDNRVDFRAYVRDLAKEFRTRIEMRQIGVRDEARSAKGISQCGRPCCCSYWLHRFTPICIRMVKEQNLALNPAKISGLCGRLMCCMSFEHEMYEEIWKKLPNPGSKLKTPNGNYIVDGVDLKSESVLIRYPEGKEVPVSVTDFDKFKNTVISGLPWGAQGESFIPRNQSVKHKKEEEIKENGDAVRHVRAAPKQGKISLEGHLAASAAAAVKDGDSKKNMNSKKNVKHVLPEINKNEITGNEKNENEKNAARKPKLRRKRLHKHKRAHNSDDGEKKE